MMKQESEDLISFKRNLKGVKDLVDKGITRVPSVYVKPQNECHQNVYLSITEAGGEIEIPEIDVSDLDGEGRPQIVNSIGQACEKFGIFQVINHGVETNVCQNMMKVCQEFFNLPTEEKMKHFTDDHMKPVRFGTSVNVASDAVLEWRDFLKCNCWPVSDFIDMWPPLPCSFREIAAEYCEKIASLSKQLLSAVSESLCLESEYFYDNFGMCNRAIVANHYPACPNPDVTVGLRAHSDLCGITILMQDDVSGLEVLKEGRWIAVRPLRDALVVHMADQAEILTNGRYKSVVHRASVNAERERFSIATFVSPSADKKIAPIPELLGEQPPLYRECIFLEYIQNAFTPKPNKLSFLDSLKLDGY